MEHKRAWLLYVVVRVLAFAIPFVAVVVALPSWPYAWVVGALAGTVIGLCVSYIFLKPQRDRIADDIAEMRGRRDTRSDDERDEDRTLDEAETPDDAATGDENETPDDDATDDAATPAGDHTSAEVATTPDDETIDDVAEPIDDDTSDEPSPSDARTRGDDATR